MIWEAVWVTLVVTTYVVIIAVGITALAIKASEKKDGGAEDANRN